jgi:uncharacterized membrane protein YcaP (DUF421 family)
MALDWQGMFVPQTSLPELIVRGSCMYLFLFCLLRVLVRRHVGAFSLTDLLVIVLIADAAQNAMAGAYTSITGGMVLCTTIVGWSFFFDWLAYYFPAVRPLLEPPALPLINQGRFITKHLRKELISEDELLSQLRMHGVDDLKDVRIASIEPDGQISVFKNDGDSADPPPKKRLE